MFTDGFERGLVVSPDGLSLEEEVNSKLFFRLNETFAGVSQLRPRIEEGRVEIVLSGQPSEEELEGMAEEVLKTFEGVEVEFEFE